MPDDVEPDDEGVYRWEAYQTAAEFKAHMSAIRAEGEALLEASSFLRIHKRSRWT